MMTQTIEDENEMFGMTRSEIFTSIQEQLTISSKEMIVASAMSDIQEELLHHGLDKEVLRKKLNVLKYILFTDFN